MKSYRKHSIFHYSSALVYLHITFNFLLALLLSILLLIFTFPIVYNTRRIRSFAEYEDNNYQ